MRILKGHWQLILLSFVVFALWATPLVLPIKFLIVFLHELSHALAGLLTGGEVIEIGLSAHEGGHTFIRGGASFVILTAGYLGSLLFGVGLLLAALKTRWDHWVLAGLGTVTLIATLIYMRDPFPVTFGLAAGGVMLAMARFLQSEWNDLALRLIGLTSMIYVPFDVISDTLVNASQLSDARMLAQEFGGTTAIWGGLWLVLSLIVIGLCLRYGLGTNSNIALRAAPARRKSPARRRK